MPSSLRLTRIIHAVALLAATAAGMVALGHPAVAAGSGPSGGANPSGLPWRSGYYTPTQGNEAQMAAFEEWRGRKSDITLLFMGRDYFNKGYDGWAGGNTLKAGGTLERVTERGLTVALAVPLLAKEDAGDFRKVAEGGLDDVHRDVARRIHEIVGPERIYVRLGWEANRGYPWSYSGAGENADPQVYKDAYRRIASIYKAELPGARIVWNHLKRHTVPIADYYPGDNVVDVIGIDPYDNCQGGGCVDSDEEWRRFLGGYDPKTGMAQGLQGLLDFAKSRGKTLSVCEWGASNEAEAEDFGSNNPFYVAAMFEFFERNARWIEYENYFGSAKHRIHPAVPYLEEVSGAYRAAWRP
jgi:Glycosyl hydrolase family 26